MSQENIPIHLLIDSNIIAIEKIDSCDPINFDGVHRHDFYEILFFTEVEYDDTHSIDFVEYSLSINTFYILKPGQVHRMKHRRQKGYLIAISSDFFASSQSQLFTSPLYSYEITFDKEEDVQQAIQLFNLMVYEYAHAQRSQLLHSFLDSLIIMLETSNQDPYYSEPMDLRIPTLLSLVEESFKVVRNISFFAQKLSVSNKTLNRLSVKYLGQTVKQILQKRLLLEAQRRIAITNLSFQEIAFELGFMDASYFTRFFKEQSGKTPEQFKESLRR